jgi:hypothetical protein
VLAGNGSPMRILSIGLGLAGFLTLAATAAVTAEIGAADKISVTGVGTVKFGMTLEQAAAAGVPMTASAHDPKAACYFVHPASPAGLSFMVRDGKLVRADMIKPANLTTVDGFKRGDKEGAVAGYYAAEKGGVSDFPLSSDSDVSVLAAPEFSLGDDVPRLVYEVTDAAGVTAIHAGWVPRHFGGCPK